MRAIAIGRAEILRGACPAYGAQIDKIRECRPIMRDVTLSEAKGLMRGPIPLYGTGKRFLTSFGMTIGAGLEQVTQ